MLRSNPKVRIEAPVNGGRNYNGPKVAKFEAIEAEFQKEMDDDFNAANGMTVLYQWLKEWNVYLEQEVVSKAVLEALAADHPAPASGLRRPDLL